MKSQLAVGYPGLLYSSGTPGQPPRHTTSPFSNVTTPAAMPFLVAPRDGCPATFAFLPIKSSGFQRCLFAATAPPLAVTRHKTLLPSASVTSTIISECGLTVLKDVITPWISMVFFISKKVLNEWCASAGRINVKHPTANMTETRSFIGLLHLSDNPFRSNFRSFLRSYRAACCPAVPFPAGSKYLFKKNKQTFLPLIYMRPIGRSTRLTPARLRARPPNRSQLVRNAGEDRVSRSGS